MELLELTNGHTVTPSPYFIQLDRIKLLKQYCITSCTNQTTKEVNHLAANNKFIKFLTYIYYMGHPMSPYKSYPADIQEKKVIEHLFSPEESKNWVTPGILKDSLEVYKDLVKSKAERSLEVMRQAIDRIVEFYSTLNLNRLDKMGRPVFNVNEVTNAIGNFGKTYESLKKLEDQVKQDISNTKIRGGVELNEFNR